MFENLTKEQIIDLLNRAGMTKERLEREVLNNGIIRLYLTATKENTIESWTKYKEQLEYLLEAKDIAPSHKELLELYIRETVGRTKPGAEQTVFKRIVK